MSLSKVPSSKIYHVLDQLHEKGLVEILVEYPKRYAPAPLGDYLDRLHEEHASASRAIERDRAELVASFSLAGGARIPGRGAVTSLKGRRVVLDAIATVIEKAERTLLVLGTEGFAARAEAHRELLAAATRRGVRIRVLLPPGVALPARIAGTAEVRVLAETGVGGIAGFLVVADAKRALVAHAVPDDASVTRGDASGIVTDEEGVVAPLRRVLEAAWNTAVEPPARTLAFGTVEDATRTAR